MSRRKRVKLSNQPLHHYPPLLLSPIIHDDQHHSSLPAYPTASAALPQPSSISQTPPPKTSPPSHSSSHFPTRLPLTHLTSLPSLPPSSLSSLSLSTDPFLLTDDQLPDPDAAVACAVLSATPLPHTPPEADEGVPGTPASSASAAAPPVQRLLSYESAVGVVREVSGVGGEDESEGGSEVVVRTISIPPLLEGLDDYPSLRELMDEEEEEEARRREALEREMAAPWSELLDDAEEEEEEWERRMQRNRERRREEEQQQRLREAKAAEERKEADGDGGGGGGGEDDEELRPTAVVAVQASPSRGQSVADADEFAVTQVVTVDRSADWAEPSQSQTQRSTPLSATQWSSASPGRRSHRPASASPSSRHGGEGEESVTVERVIAPVHRHSRRIFLSNSSSASATPV